ncbi:ADM_collapsed_G0028520.mRNA.1.CDS.1 [Saccharomyces cerevisiae]|nr:ADM_collapsed_G0028520.mRNA.1.CDS.1 [Saccharomyces cerevisiae]
MTSAGTAGSAGTSSCSLEGTIDSRGADSEWKSRNALARSAALGVTPSKVPALDGIPVDADRAVLQDKHVFGRNWNTFGADFRRGVVVTTLA